MSDSKLQYKKMSLEELVVLSQQNDLKALEELIKREQKNVFAAFSYLTDKRENISDLTQEALMRVAKNIANLKNPKNFKSWLNTIITNLFMMNSANQRANLTRFRLMKMIAKIRPLIFSHLFQIKKCKPPEKMYLK